MKAEVEHKFFQDQIQRNYRNTIKHFKKCTMSFSLFQMTFLLFFAIEALFFLLFFSFLSKSLLLAFSVGAIFLTAFIYLVLLFYFQTKKPEDLLYIRDRFLQACRQLISFPKGVAEHHISVAKASLTLASHLQDFEYSYFYVGKKMQGFFAPFLKEVSSFFHKNDVLKMKELLLLAAIDELIEQIRTTPIDLEVHAQLANVYVSLSKLYKEYLNDNRIISKQKTILLNEKFEKASQKAIEEFKILSDYAPNDPWVHAQLAKSYRFLEMPIEEAKEYEILLKLNPQDFEVLFRLGVTYFEMGKNAAGLKVYEELKRSESKKGEELLSYYGGIPSFAKNEES